MAEIDISLIDTRASRGIVKDFDFQYGRDQATGLQPPDIHYDILLDMFRADPVLSTAFDITVDAVTQNGFRFLGKNKDLIKEANKLFYNTFDFDRILDNILYSMLIYGDAFLELRRFDGSEQIKELHPLETVEMKIDYTENGEVTGYIQVPPGKASKPIYFTPENVVHFRMKWIGSRVHSYNPNESIAKSYATKVYANDYLQRIFRFLPPKMIHILNNANDDEIQKFKEDNYRVSKNPRLDLIVKANGKPSDSYDFKEFQVKFDNGLGMVMDYLRQEVLMITRVPPIWVGLMGQGNRSTSEALIYPFETRVRKLQKIISSHLNKFLLPQLGLSSLDFIFNPVSFSTETSIVQIAGQMKAMGIDAKEGDDHPVIHYLKAKGIQIPDSTFMPEIDPMEAGSPQIQKDTATSRQRENKQTGKMTSKLNEKGVSAAGKEKMDKVKKENQ